MRYATLALLTVLPLAATASAQTSPPPPKARGSSPGIHGFATIDGNSLAASDSFEAVFGTSTMTAYGGGAEVVDLWKHLFLRIAVSQSKKTGSRVFVSNGDVFHLGIPLSVTMMPVEGGGGWRFASKSRLTPYVGGAFVSLGYKETSQFAGADENVDERFKGGAVFGGVDLNLWKGIVVGGEAQFRGITVPDASRGVMKEFNEKDLGGFTARITIGFTTK
jgi:hypothetical protein